MATNNPINISQLKTILSATLPNDQKLRGSDNWITWQSSIIVLFRLFFINSYFEDENQYSKIKNEEKIAALVIIRQNLTEKPLSLVLTEQDPGVIWKTLKASYEGSGPVLRQQLYLEFHQIKAENYKNIVQFISKFNDTLTRLKDCGASIEPTD